MPSVEERLRLLELLLHNHSGVQGVASNKLPHPNIHISTPYTVTNGTADRTYDADTVVVAELADIVYTLIQDLKTLGILS